MHSSKTIFLPLALSLVVTATAATCSGDWLQNTFKGDTKCCYGNMLIDGSDAFCCVYDLNPLPQTTSTSTATTTSDDYAGWSTAGDGCFTKVPFSASNYSELVSSASSEIAASRTTVATNEAKSTGTSTSSASSSSSGTSSNTSGASSRTSAASASVTSNAALPVATAQEMILGGAAVAVGLFML